MSESRICPVCENEIPEDARFLCPHCHFELKWLDDESAIQEAKQNFTGELFTVEKDKQDESAEEPWPSLGNHFIAGILGGAVAQIVYLKWGPYIEWGWALFCLPFHCLPIGLLTGFLGYLLGKKLNRGLGIRFVFLILTFILSIVFGVILRVIIREIIGFPW